MEQLFTSWYCPSCEGGDNSDVKETPDSSRKPQWNWRLYGSIRKAEHHLLGYSIELGTKFSIFNRITLKRDEIIAGCQLLDFLVGDHQDGYTLYYRDVDNKYYIAQPGWYWKNSQWKYDKHK